MKVITLSGSEKLSKTIQLIDSKEIKKWPYPNILRFTSEEHECKTIKQLYGTILAAAKKGNCLLKGKISRPLENTSRAGSTNSLDSTEWICLDVDNLNVETTNEFLNLVHLQNISHVVQYSASHSLAPGLRAHIFMLLNKPVLASTLKIWLQHLNLIYLNEHIQLSRTGIALSWPLDITTCQNDKLLYVAPPTLLGIVDPMPTGRIVLIDRDHPVLSIDQINLKELQKTPELTKTLLKKKQKEAGLNPNRTKAKFITGVEHQYGLSPLQLTEMREDRGFRYFNINHGDSWAYYHPIENYEFIYNFKGEPIMKTEEIFPEYYQQQLEEHPPVFVNPDAYVDNAVLNGDEMIPMIFRDVSTDQLYNGIWWPQEKKHEFYPTKNEKRLEHFMLQHNRTMGEFVPQWKMIFNPENNVGVDLEKRIINLWQPTKFFEMPSIALKDCQAKHWPIIDKLFRHVIGDTPTIQDHWLNWLAVIFQTKKKTMTAYVISTTFGAGKGLIAMKVLRPLLGEHCVVRRQSELQSQFNSYMRNALLVIVDEAEISSLQNDEVIDSDLKNFITEPMITIRGMHKEAVLVESRANFIFISNKPKVVNLPEHDRRYNVALFQPQVCPLTDDEIDNQIPAELPFFFQYIMQRSADEVKARKVLDTPQRHEMMLLSKTTAQALADNILAGNTEFLIQQLPDLNILNNTSPQSIKAAAYVDFMRNHLADALVNKKQKLTRDELLLIFDYCVGNMPVSPTKFSQFLNHKGITLKKIRNNNTFAMGIDYVHKCSDLTFQEGLNSLTQKPKLKMMK